MRPLGPLPLWDLVSAVHVTAGLHRRWTPAATHHPWENTDVPVKYKLIRTPHSDKSLMEGWRMNPVVQRDPLGLLPIMRPSLLGSCHGRVTSEVDPCRNISSMGEHRRTGEVPAYRNPVFRWKRHNIIPSEHPSDRRLNPPETHSGTEWVTPTTCTQLHAAVNCSLLPLYGETCLRKTSSHWSSVGQMIC